MSLPIKRRGRYKQYLYEDDIPVPTSTWYKHLAKGDYLTSLINTDKTNFKIKV